MSKKPFINPDIQPSEGVEIYRGASFRAFSKPRGQDAIKSSINIPMPIIRDAIKSFDIAKMKGYINTAINFAIVIGIAAIVILWAILEGRQ